VPDTWSAKTSQVLRAIRAPRPSKAPGRPQRDGRIGKKAAAKLRARIAALEAAIADRPTAPVEIKQAGSLKPESAKSRAPSVEQPDHKTGDPGPGLPPDPDARRPDPAVVEARAVSAEALHRHLAEGFRRHAFAMNLAASRGLSGSRWSSPYWRSSPYRPGF
jgi:hypothetical protein